jgi:hypothetical protein
LPIKNQLPRLSRTALIVIIAGGVVVVWFGVVWCGGFITDYKTTPTKVVLSCFGLLVGLWQFTYPYLSLPYVLCQLTSVLDLK